MSELKMSDVFNKLEYKNGRDVDTGELVDANGGWWATFNSKQSAMHASVAINSYDSHTEQIAKLAKDVELLRKALKLVKVNLSYSQDAFAGEYIQMAKKALSETGLSN